MAEKIECIVCGRKFPIGQGIIINIGGKDYAFHRKTCAIKFLRRLIEELDENVVKSAARTVEREFKEKLREKMELTAKKLV